MGSDTTSDPGGHKVACQSSTRACASGGHEEAPSNDSPQTFETRFAFDSFGRMLSLWYPDGEQLDYTYDTGGLVSHAQGHRPATKHWEEATEVYLGSLTYDESGQRRSAVLGNGATTTWTYEPDTQRLKHLDTSSQGRSLQALTYTYDLVGNVKTLTNSLGEATGRRSGAVSYKYDYDDLYRLTQATGTAKSRPGVNDSFKTTYAFDETHNMTRLDQKHWLTTANDPTNETAHPPHTNHDFDYVYGNKAPHQASKIGDRNMVYDANGNTLRECRDHGDASCNVNSDKMRRYFWGEENELNAVIDGGGRNITRFVYDAGGDRVVKLGRGGESITIGQFWSLKGRRAATKHIFGGAIRLASKVLPPPGWGAQPTNPTTVATTSPTVAGNINGCDPSNYQPQKCPVLPGGDPEINHQYDDTRVRPETYYYHPDHLGSTSWVTDQHARVHEHVEYFPYGEVWREPRSDADGAPVKGQRFLYTGKELDEETGLVYFGARYMAPSYSRWLGTDPELSYYLDGSRNKKASDPRDLSNYAYAAWNPIVFVDPNGRWIFSIHWAMSSEAMTNPGFRYIDSLTMYRAQWNADFGPGAQDDQAAHAMRAPDPNTGRSITPIGAYGVSLFTASTLLDQAIDEMKSGRRGKAMGLLFKGSHLIQDQFSPPHEGYQEYSEKDIAGSARHIAGDVYAGMTNGKAYRRGVDASKRYYDLFFDSLGDHPMVKSWQRFGKVQELMPPPPQ